MSEKNNILIPLYHILSLVAALMFLVTLFVGSYILTIGFLLLAVSNFLSYLNLKYEGK